MDFACPMLLAIAVCAANPPSGPWTIEPQESWSNVFGARDVEFHYKVTGPEALQGRVGWALRADQRTLERGEAEIHVAAGKPGSVAIKLRVPAVKEQVVLAASLTVHLIGQRGEGLARHDRPVLVFAENPFAGRSEWIKKRKLVLFDPEGGTAQRLETTGVQFDHRKRVDAIEAMTEGMLVVAEGLSLTKHRRLGEVMLAAASRGVPVVCLAPCEGKLPLPGADSTDGPMPREVSFQREEAVIRLDKRLDGSNWPPDRRAVASSLFVRGEKGQVVAAIESGAKGWPWLEVRYPAPGARLVLCGFGVVEHWDATPTARYLLARLLEYVGDRTENPKLTGKDER